MQIRIWNAFASNNSGSYTIVGTFRPGAAGPLADRIAEVLVRHRAWAQEPDASRDAESPLYRFFRDEGVSVEPSVGAGDDWPAYGEPPRVIAVGNEILLHAPYTVTMPRAFGALFYRHGGRVELELDHAHSPLLLTATTWTKDGYLPEMAAERDRRQSAFRADVEDGRLDEAMRPEPYEERAPWPPVFEPGEWGAMRTTIAPSDLVAAAQGIRELAAVHGLELRLHVSESRGHEGDPLATLRAYTLHPGQHQVILWKAGPDPITTMRALRDISGCSLAEAHEKLASLPIEVVVDVADREAMAALETLKQVGCEAQMLGPRDFAPGKGSRR